MKRLIAGIALAMGLAAPAHAIEYSYRLYGSRSIVIDAAGVIQPNERAVFVGWWYSLPRDIQRKKTAGWVFNSSGGILSGAVDLGEIVARSGTNTRVAANGICASACVMLWANGALKSAAPDSQIGVHNASVQLPDGTSTGAYSYATDTAMAKYLAARGAPASVLGHLVVTESDSIHWLTADELAQWNVHITY
jgi:hypothetical protein